MSDCYAFLVEYKHVNHKYIVNKLKLEHCAAKLTLVTACSHVFVSDQFKVTFQIPKWPHTSVKFTILHHQLNTCQPFNRAVYSSKSDWKRLLTLIYGWMLYYIKSEWKMIRFWYKRRKQSHVFVCLLEPNFSFCSESFPYLKVLKGPNCKRT